MLTSEILPDHIDILVALRVVLGQLCKLNVLFLLPVERDRQNAAPIIPDGRGRCVALPGSVTPQLEFTCRAVIRIRRVLPDFGGLIILYARERQVQAAAVIELPHLCACLLYTSYSSGFTLDTYTHVTRKMQEEAAEKMGQFMEMKL